MQAHGLCCLTRIVSCLTFSVVMSLLHRWHCNMQQICCQIICGQIQAWAAGQRHQSITTSFIHDADWPSVCLWQIRLWQSSRMRCTAGCALPMLDHRKHYYLLPLCMHMLTFCICMPAYHLQLPYTLIVQDFHRCLGSEQWPQAWLMIHLCIQDAIECS